ncbi:drug:proton antiporter [Siculibacillus lacustris]|uniref:Drug:proton antiporter n=1 Tax=Siculibacillus lacustris TaxID=1549641 RepID=A0A4Q9VL43_9HYPH|nr:VOC family protein [Siculibacillus lacustris]TBW35932.1 drug:proton antiporter [Siculibacillus lacustris]
MPDASMLILYVDAPRAAATFWSGLLGREPVELSDTFAMLPLRPGLMLGLWSRHTVEPAAAAAGGGGEVVFGVADPAAVDATHADWVARGLPILQSPCDMDFGRTFVALDPDGHRLRVYTPAA